MSDNFITLAAIQEILSEAIMYIPTGIGREKVTEANIHLLNLLMKMKKSEENPVQAEHFQYYQDLIKSVNQKSVEIISITAAGKYSEGYILFYKEK